jgi:hypothetical protein
LLVFTLKKLAVCSVFEVAKCVRIGVKFVFNKIFFPGGGGGTMAEEGVPDMTLISDMDETGINRNLQVDAASCTQAVSGVLYGTVVSTVLLRHFFLDIIIRVKRR